MRKKMSNKENKKTILLVSFVFSPNIGGVESHLDDLCEYLTKKGFYVIVISCQPLASKKMAPYFEKKYNMEIHRIRWFRFSLFNKFESIPVLEVLYLVPPMLFASGWYLLKNLKKVDIIQVHGFNMTIVGSIVSFLFRKKFVVNTHVSFNFSKGSFYSFLIKLFLSNASRILVLTNAAKKELIKIGIQSSKIFLYHQWIDEKLFKPKNKTISRKKFNLPIDAFVVCFTGRFVEAKGVLLLLKAVPQLRSKIIVTFVGSGPLMNKIQEDAKLHSQIRFIGQINRENLPYYYSAADVCIIPSIQVTDVYSEGIPRVMIESYTCGTPVIATKTGGVKEFINPNIGFFTIARSDAISKTLNQLSLKKQILSKMRQKCILFAKEEFTMKINGEKIVQSIE
jgi:glycosyltransferase involved in cell wall biosynthesis